MKMYTSLEILTEDHIRIDETDTDILTWTTVCGGCQLTAETVWTVKGEKRQMTWRGTPAAINLVKRLMPYLA